MIPQKVVIFYFPDLDQRSLEEIEKQLRKVLNKYAVEPLVTNCRLQTISKDELNDILIKAGDKMRS